MSGFYGPTAPVFYFSFYFIFIPHCPFFNLLSNCGWPCIPDPSVVTLRGGDRPASPLVVVGAEKETQPRCPQQLDYINPGVRAKRALSNSTTFPFGFSIIIITVITAVWTFSPSVQRGLGFLFICGEL